MICLDTNYLIRGLVQGSAEEKRLVRWVEEGELLCAPMVAWFEFLCGPVSELQITTARAFLSEIVSFDERHAEEAARLFNSTGRKRPLRIDATIAAAAIVTKARLATDNRADFEPFVLYGLQLV